MDCSWRGLFSRQMTVPTDTPPTLVEAKEAFDGMRVKAPQAPRWLKLAPQAKVRLSRLFGRFGLDLGRLSFSVRVMHRLEGLCYGDTIYLLPSFGGWWYDEQLALLAHEITHSVQYRILGRGQLNVRHSRERQLYPVDHELYQPPDALTRTPIAEVNPVSPAYTLEQLAERFANAITTGR